MKKIVCLMVVYVASLLFSSASDFRMWTDAKTGRTITAKILDKKAADMEVKLRIKGGKVVWLETSRLSKDDQVYVKEWVKPVEHVSARVIGSKRGGMKKLKVTVNAGAKSMKVDVHNCVPNRHTTTKEFTKGEVTEFEIMVYSDYVIKAYEGDKNEKGEIVWGRMIDEETSKRKTGL